MKNVIFWDAKKAPLRNKSGQEIPNEYHGVFSTKVQAGTPMSFHYKGENKDAKIQWDYHARESTVIRGKLRWVDKILPTFTGARAQIALFIEGEKSLHRVTIKYDAVNLNNVMNALCGMGKDIHNEFINLTYWVRKAKDAKGALKVDDKGNVKWAQNLIFQDVTPKFTFDEWKDFAQQNGLEWGQIKKADGKKEWKMDAELKYWDSKMLAIQRFLLKEEVALPFTYGSLIACEAPNPSGGGNLNTAEIAECTRIYERIKTEYKMPFGRVEVDADDFDPGAKVVATQSEFIPEDELTFEDDMRTVPEIENNFDDSLPF